MCLRWLSQAEYSAYNTYVFNFLEGDVVYAAQRLLGCDIIRVIEDKPVKARIVETEAYHQSDAASHSYRGKTKRNSVMFGKPGVAYVYFTYGMHYCMNIVTGKEGEASAVLIRAVEPIIGHEVMQKNRIGANGVSLSNGPAKLCQAMKIDKTLNGHNLSQDPLRLIINPILPVDKIQASTRIGISKEQQKPWRFYIKNNKFVSKK